MTTRHADALAGATLVIMWSSGFVGAALGTRFAPAGTLLAWRYVVAAAVLAAVAVWRRSRVGARGLRQQGVLGLLCQCCYLGGVVTGVGLGVPAGTAALIAAAQPLIVATLAGPVLGEHVSGRQRLGLVIALAGVALVVAGDLGLGTAPTWAFLLPVGGMLALTTGTLLERRMRPAESPLDALTIQTVVAAGFFVGVAGAAGDLAPPADPRFWWAVAWVVALSSFGGYGSYLLVLRRSGAMRVSTLLYLTPPTTMAWTFLMFGEVPGPLVLPGAALCAIGVYLALISPRAGAPAPSAPIRAGRRTGAGRTPR